MGSFGLCRYTLQVSLQFRLYLYAAVPGYEGTRGTRYHSGGGIHSSFKTLLIFPSTIAVTGVPTRPPAVDDSHIPGSGYQV